MRHVSLMNFCDVRVGIKMIDQNDAYTAFMPCTISLVEGKDGKLWLYSLNMDFLIHGAKELPPDLKADALQDPPHDARVNGGGCPRRILTAPSLHFPATRRPPFNAYTSDYQSTGHQDKSIFLCLND